MYFFLLRLHFVHAELFRTIHTVIKLPLSSVTTIVPVQVPSKFKETRVDLGSFPRRKKITPREMGVAPKTFQTKVW